MAAGADRSIEFNSYNLLVLDLLHLIYRCIRPEELGKDQSSSSAKLAQLLADEERGKALSIVNKSSRHSRFGTTLQVRTVRLYTGLSLIARRSKESFFTARLPSQRTLH